MLIHANLRVVATPDVPRTSLKSMPNFRLSNKGSRPSETHEAKFFPMFGDTNDYALSNVRGLGRRRNTGSRVAAGDWPAT
jgi:hypothetical protein